MPIMSMESQSGQRHRQADDKLMTRISILHDDSVSERYLNSRNDLNRFPIGSCPERPAPAPSTVVDEKPFVRDTSFHVPTSLAPAIPCYSWPGTVPGPWHRAALGRLAPATPRKRTLWAPLTLCRDFAAPFRLGSQKRWRRQPCSGRVALQQAGAHKLRALSIEARPTRGQRPQQQRKTSTYRYRLLFTCQKKRPADPARSFLICNSFASEAFARL